MGQTKKHMILGICLSFFLFSCGSIESEGQWLDVSNQSNDSENSIPSDDLPTLPLEPQLVGPETISVRCSDDGFGGYQVTVSWDEVLETTATELVIERDLFDSVADNYFQVGSVSTSATQFIDTGVSPGFTGNVYFYKVFGRDESTGDESDRSIFASIIVSDSVGSPCNPFVPPTL